MTIAINELVLCSFHPNVVMPSQRNVYSCSKRRMYTSMVTQALEQDPMKQNGRDACFITVLPGIMSHCTRIDGYHSLDKWSVLNRAWSMAYGSLGLELLSNSGLPVVCHPLAKEGKKRQEDCSHLLGKKKETVKLTRSQQAFQEIPISRKRRDSKAGNKSLGISRTKAHKCCKKGKNEKWKTKKKERRQGLISLAIFGSSMPNWFLKDVASLHHL